VPAVIDADLHNVVPSVEALVPYLSDHWREYVRQSAFRGPADTAYPPGAATSARPGSAPPAGGPPGSSLDLLREQVLDAWDMEYGILTCTYAVDSIHNPDSAAAMASAVNDWQVAEWLDKEPRLRASIVVPRQQPALAAQEIDRVAGDRRFVQVLLPVRSERPYGNRIYQPIFEAAVRHDLVVGLHFGGAPGNPPTASGWPSTYVEEYVGMAAAFQTQILNLIVEGLFDEFPTLRVAMIEGGFTWLPGLMWRIDKEWKGLKRETPWNRQVPSAYVRDHLRFTIQPIDAPPDPAHFRQILEHLGSDDLLMFSTDYPHYHFDTPEEALPIQLPDRLAAKIMSENARAFYRL
jgi:predicted TIM-barrel fold metal-dependent hydrolase